MSGKDWKNAVRAVVYALFFVAVYLSAAISGNLWLLIPSGVFGLLSVWAVTGIRS